MQSPPLLDGAPEKATLEITEDGTVRVLALRIDEAVELAQAPLARP